MAAPTEKEYALLEKFRENIKDLSLKDEQQEDMFLLSWIRARENDLGKAEDMLRKSLKWREANDMENIFDWTPPAHFAKEYPYDISGNDAEGSPVLVCPIGIWDVRKTVEAGQQASYVRFVDQTYSKLYAKLREEPARKMGQTQFCVVVDMKGLSLRQFTSPSTVETILETFRRFESNFPETLKSATVINAPRIFPMAFALVKPLLSGRTLNKIQIFADAKKWKPALLSMFPEHVIPVEWGGTFVTGSSKLDMSNKISSANIIEDRDGHLIEAMVAAGSKFMLDFDVESEGSILRWEFKTDSYDIGFSVIYGPRHETVVEFEKYNANEKKVEGSMVCERVGTYTLVFDNSYSRLRSKTVRYLATVQADEISTGGDQYGEDSTSL